MDDRQEDQNDLMQPSGRKASVQLRDRAKTARGEQHKRMDAANQSLADALRITYKLLQAGMFVLVVLYLISGLQSINEGERGIAVRLGKITKPNLEPGFQWSWPYPIGEIVRVGEGSVELPIGTSFMPNLPGDKSRGNIQEAAMEADIKVFSSSSQLKPERDGSHTPSGVCTTVVRITPSLSPTSCQGRRTPLSELLSSAVLCSRSRPSILMI
jgi:hypothetical protein